MRKGSRDIPPPLEIDCLKALWTLGEANVKQVRQALNKDRQLAYTTVMTLLDRLAKRGSVARRKVGRSFVYSPVLTMDEVRRAALADFVDSYFDGSAEALRQYVNHEL